MRRLFIIGVGAGNPDYITVQAINALEQAHVIFVIDKGEFKGKAGNGQFLKRGTCAAL